MTLITLPPQPCAAHVFTDLDHQRDLTFQGIFTSLITFKNNKNCLQNGVLMGCNFKSITLQWFFTVTVEPSGALGRNLCI